MTDEQETCWIRQVVEHDDHLAFSRLMQLHQSAVRQFLRRLTHPDEARADDLAQETFWKAYRYLYTFQGRGSLRSWLFKVAFQIFAGDQRKSRPTQSLEAELVDPQASTTLERLSLQQVMDSLRSEERAVLVLHYQFDMTHQEVAIALDQPLGSVKTLILRARQKLKALF